MKREFAWLSWLLVLIAVPLACMRPMFKPFQPGKTNEKDGSVLIRIPGGTFTLGSTEESDYNPSHQVTLSPYLIGKYPVTNEQFGRFVGASGYQTDAEREGGAEHWTGSKLIKVKGASWRAPSGPGSWAEPLWPVVCVSWNDANRYCAWAGLRLPTDDEWEYACRSTDGRLFAWGNDWDANKCCNSVATARTGPAPVGSYPAGASPFGCLDMTGNVFQWTTSPIPDGGCVLRGGSWLYNEPGYFLATTRFYGSENLRIGVDNGLRVACGEKVH